MIQLPKAFLDAPIAHRGYHDVQNGRPENSRAAFQAAISMGYGIELDVQLSLDDQAMVFHDEELQRLTGQEGLVRSRPQTDLASIPLLHGSETIPGLSEILDLVAGQVPLLIEIKDQDGGMGPNVGPLEAAVAAAIASYEGPLAVMSFNPNAIRAFLQHTQAWPVGLVTSSYEESAWPELEPEVCHHLRDIPDYEELGASFISHEVHDLRAKVVSDIRTKGGNILCWTVRSEEVEKIARGYADNITFEGYAAQMVGG